MFQTEIETKMPKFKFLIEADKGKEFSYKWDPLATNSEFNRFHFGKANFS